MRERGLDGAPAGPSTPGGEVLLELIGDVVGLLDIDELRAGLIEALHRALPSDYVSLNDVHPDPSRVVALISPPADERLLAAWRDHAHENPLLRHVQVTGDGRATRFSDVITREDYHSLALYRRVYAPIGVEHQMAFTLPGPPGRVIAIALSRRSHDYSDAERELADSARPFLIQAYLNALQCERLRAGAAAEPPATAALLELGLTPREADVLRMLSLGRSNRDIAVELGISPRTVGKHLEHGFRKLGVSDRSSAAARVWELSREGSGHTAAPGDAGSGR